MNAGTASRAEDSQVIPIEAQGPDDAALLWSFAERNDRQAMGILFTRHADAAYRLALRICRRSADAEDAVQAAFYEVLRHAAKYRGESAVRAWILGFVVNSCRHKAREEGRRAAREERAAAPEGASASPPEAREAQETVRNAVQELPERYRVPVWLHYCEGLSSGEVAAALSLSENTVRSQLSRGVEQLRGALAAYGLAVSATGLSAALSTAAAETAPPALAASLAGIASGSAPAAAGTVAKAGLLAKTAAGSVAAAAVCSTAAFLWFGVPEARDITPPEFARVEQRVREWQPRPDERRFDEIGWAKDLRHAQHLSRQHGRPVLALTLAGPVNRGRSDGGSLSLRAEPLSDARVISLLNRSFIPVYILTDGYDRKGSVPREEKAEYSRIYNEAIRAQLSTGVEHLYILEPGTGRVVDSMNVCHATTPLLLERLEKFVLEAKASSGAPAVKPGPQVVPPPAAADALVLHLTARYLDKEGNVDRGRGSYHEFPAEDWVVFPREEAGRLLPSEPAPVGTAYGIDPALAARLLCRIYPLTGNFRDASTNPILEQALTGQVVSRLRNLGWVRLEGRVKMKHPFFLKDDENLADAAVVGFMEIDFAEKRVRTFLMITEKGVYGLKKENFGVAVRSLR